MNEAEFNQALAARNGFMAGWASFEFTSDTPALANSGIGCENTTLGCRPLDQEAGHFNYGLAKEIHVSFSHCPYKIDARCSTKNRQYPLNPVADGGALIGYQLVNTYDPQKDLCTFDVTKPIYMNVQSRCVAEDGVTPAPCKWLHAWSMN